MSEEKDKLMFEQRLQDVDEVLVEFIEIIRMNCVTYYANKYLPDKPVIEKRKHKKVLINNVNNLLNKLMEMS